MAWYKEMSTRNSRIMFQPLMLHISDRHQGFLSISREEKDNFEEEEIDFSSTAVRHISVCWVRGVSLSHSTSFLFCCYHRFIIIVLSVNMKRTNSEVLKWVAERHSGKWRKAVMPGKVYYSDLSDKSLEFIKYITQWWNSKLMYMLYSHLMFMV